MEGKKKEESRRKNIVFARGGAHLPTAHALRLPETELIYWGGDFWGAGDFIGDKRFVGCFLDQGIVFALGDFFFLGGGALTPFFF